MNYSTEIKLITCQSKRGTDEIRSSNDVKSLLRIIERVAHKILPQSQGRSLFLLQSIESSSVCESFCCQCILGWRFLQQSTRTHHFKSAVIFAITVEELTESSMETSASRKLSLWKQQI
ncbi:hypothetical protein CEXT_216871 [Caerostris extrusa]|uniref:Uncharacterized protein n=1 Tax=Caerostris extrusa TaxID=172846 RepID=A0AAV4XWH4_CAEEX|nr:hypothetical protein CEXT_216871 [Caerostris extrusa]